MDPAPDLRLGKRYDGRYDIERVLGEGGMGTVYAARHAFTGRAVALKILHSIVARSTLARERFLREAQLPSSVGHPGIVEVLDAGISDDDGSLYLALELLDGEDLATAAGRGAVDVARAVAIGAELLDALAAAHRAGLVHRDIKPENVFLERDPDGTDRVRLLDFGITRQLRDTEEEKLTRTGTILGTPHFMSPEQARGSEVDPRSDLFAVGGVLFDVIAGRPPFAGTNYNVLIVAIMTTSAPSLRTVREDVPEELAAIVDRALARDPEARFASAEEMAAALRACPRVTLPAPPREPKPAPAPPKPTSGAPESVQGAIATVPFVAATPPSPGGTPRPAQREIPHTSGVPIPLTVEAPTVAQGATTVRRPWLLPLVALGAAVIGAGVAVALLSTTSADAPDATPAPAPVVSGAEVIPMLPSTAPAETPVPASAMATEATEAEPAGESGTPPETEAAERAPAQAAAKQARRQQRAIAEAIERERERAAREESERCQESCSRDWMDCSNRGGTGEECHREAFQCRNRCR